MACARCPERQRRSRPSAIPGAVSACIIPEPATCRGRLARLAITPPSSRRMAGIGRLRIFLWACRSKWTKYNAKATEWPDDATSLFTPRSVPG
jgi:hypothetical protein